MSTLLTTVTDYEDKALELISKLQDELLGYVAQAVTVLDERLPDFDLPEIKALEQLPTLSEIVDTQFAFSKKVLANQEKFAKRFVKTVKPLTRDAATTKAATKTAKATKAA